MKKQFLKKYLIIIVTFIIKSLQLESISIESPLVVEEGTIQEKNDMVILIFLIFSVNLIHSINFRNRLQLKRKYRLKKLESNCH